ncbi:hypothetical protein [Serratia fonticola]|uniref:hypothetical protein n=1 Tax=Serratia fonticola TaxID=47917 RepID=UPI00192CFDF7|nr:hypothetical protein [Serratia fonticola]MBL5825383.1 hypothetical protein [Serratia fonticola]
MSRPLWNRLVVFGALSAYHHNPMRTVGPHPTGACTPVTPAARQRRKTSGADVRRYCGSDSSEVDG